MSRPAAFLTPPLIALLLLAGCGDTPDTGSEPVGQPNASDVAAKAVADVDAAMAEAQRSGGERSGAEQR